MQLQNGDWKISNMIDIHHHIVPDVYVSALKKRGIEAAHGEGFPEWSPRMSLDMMDAYGIATAITSLSSPGVYFGDPTFAREIARECNEYAAQMVRDHPARFGFFASLPLPAVEFAIQEAVYALDTLKADGVVLLASAGEKFLGDPDFEELMSELNRRNAVVFIHPTIHPSSTSLNLNIPGFYIEFLFDTTRAVTNLLFTGTIERYPNIRWILSHAGGTIPYIAWRLSLANLDPTLLEKVPRGVLAYLKSFYYDTALSPSSAAMGALLELVNSSQILFGSDFPYAPDPLVASEISELQELELFNEDDQRCIAVKNAQSLFPALRTQEETFSHVQVPNIRQYKKVPLRTRIALSFLRKLMKKD